MNSSDSSAPIASRAIFADAIHYWERRRILYNLLLTAVVLAWIIFTWPHFLPAFTWYSLRFLLVFALLANVCYSAAYLADFFMQHSAFRNFWRRWRWSLFAAGTLFAILLANYWIADEIYAYVSAPFVGR